MYAPYQALYWPHSCWIRKLFSSPFRKHLFTPVILVFECSISIWSTSAQDMFLLKKAFGGGWGEGGGGSSGR